MKKLYIPIVLVLLLAAAGAAWLLARPVVPVPSPAALVAPSIAATAATPTIGPVSATPNIITINTASVVTVTAQITDPSLLPGGANLLRLNANGASTILGVLHDDGKNGDAAAGDHIFTLQITLNQPAQTQLQFQVSAAFRGLLKRSPSPVFTVDVFNPYGIAPPDIAARNTLAVLGKVESVQFLYSTATIPYTTLKEIVTDVTITPLKVYKGTVATFILRLGGGLMDGRLQLSLGTPTFQQGETVFLLLSGPNSEGRYTLGDDALGAFHVTQNGNAIVDAAYDSIETMEFRSVPLRNLLIRSAQGQVSLSELITAEGLIP